jgi:hypothetical protein
MSELDGLKFNLEFLLKEISSLEEECTVAEPLKKMMIRGRELVPLYVQLGELIFLNKENILVKQDEKV